MNEYPSPDFLNLLSSELRIRRLKAEYTERLKDIQGEIARVKEKTNRLLNTSSQVKKQLVQHGVNSAPIKQLIPCLYKST